MPIFYHVSRADINGFDKLELIECSTEVFPCTGAWTDEEFRKCIIKMFNGKLSAHGKTYFYNQFVYNGSGFSVHDSAVIEYTYELVRQIHFSKAPSRFQSFFAVESIEDAQKLRNETFSGHGDIYEVECEDFFKADMKLLYTGICFAGNQILANKYWSGESSDNPLWEILMKEPVRIIRKIEV